MPIACSLSRDELTDRVEDWQRVLAHVQSRSAIDGGLRLEFGPQAPVTELATLASAEQGCCGFFAFTLTLDGRGAGLEVTAPADAQPVLVALFGAAA